MGRSEGAEHTLGLLTGGAGGRASFTGSRAGALHRGPRRGRSARQLGEQRPLCSSEGLLLPTACRQTQIQGSHTSGAPHGLVYEDPVAACSVPLPCLGLSLLLGLAPWLSWGSHSSHTFVWYGSDLTYMCV